MTPPNPELVERAVAAGRARDESLSRSTKRANGIVHTPAELARWALSRVDSVLRSELGCAEGLGSSHVALLDPAVGPGVWLAAALERVPPTSAKGPAVLGFDTDPHALDAAREWLEVSGRRAWSELLLEHANTLEIADPWGRRFDGRVRVIVGNPPWAARSKSRGLTLSDRWLAEFRSDALGVSLGERRTGVLSDDYVRFFRWALEQARTSEHGAIVCLATNSSYLDGPIHRGMRAALVNAFDQIEVLDLGGNALRGGDGERDENVFGVRVGTCLTLATRRAGGGPRTAHLTYAKLTGSRADKLARLSREAQPCTTSLEPLAPFFRFIPAGKTPARTCAAFSIADAFPFHREGVQTNRDALVTDRDANTLFERLRDLLAAQCVAAKAPHLADPRARLALEASLRSTPSAALVPLAYRPLEDRVFLSLSPFCHRPRPDLALAVAQSSLCLLSARKDRGAAPWMLFGVSRNIADACYLSTRSSSRTRVFPSHAPDGSANIAAPIAIELAARAESKVSSAQLIAYALGVLASEGYRREHDAALHFDYPCLPFPVDAADFSRTVRAGEHWIQALLDVLPVEAASNDDAREVTAIAYDPARECLTTADGFQLAVTPRVWSCRVGDFRILASLAGAKRRLSRACVRHRVRRAELCVEAADLAEDAYAIRSGVAPRASRSQAQ